MGKMDGAPGRALRCRRAGLASGGITAATWVVAAHAQFCSPGFPLASMPIDCDETVVTCFGGFTGNLPQNGFDPNGYVVALVDTRSPPAPGGHWCAPTLHHPS